MDIKREISNFLLELFFPSSPFCIICKARLESRKIPICVTCCNSIDILIPPLCKRCGREKSEYCNFCRESMFFFEQARAYGHYHGVLKEIIHEFKYKGKRDLALFLGDKIYNVYKNTSWPFIDFIIPVPLHKKRFRERGFNQSLLLAKVLSQKTKIPVLDVLQRIKPTKQQVRLSRKSRRENMKNVFKINLKEKIYNKTLILVDDVYTTGTTVNECAKTLKKAGAREIYVITIARG